MWRKRASSARNALSICTALLLFGTLVGCDSMGFLSDTDPPTHSHKLESVAQTTLGPGLEITLQTPDTIATGDPFDIRTRLDNQTGETVTVTTGNVALWELGIYDGDEVVPVEGSMTGYATVVTDHHIEPGSTTSTFDLRAVHSFNENEPIEPGIYTARLTVNWHIDDRNVKDTLRTTMLFQDK